MNFFLRLICAFGLLDKISIKIDLLKVRLERIEGKVDQIKAQGVAMANAFSDLAQQMNDETNAIAARIDALIAAQQAGGMTAEEEAAALAEMQAISDRLKVLGTDPNNPIPVA